MKLRIVNESIKGSLQRQLRRAEKEKRKQFEMEVAPLKQELEKCKIGSQKYERIKRKIEKLEKSYGYIFR